MRRLIKPYNDDNFLVAAYNEFYCSGKHTHDFYEIKYIISGVGKHIINDAVFPVHSGDVYMIAPGTSHYFESKEKENPVLVYNLVDEEAVKLVQDEKLKTLLKKPYIALSDEGQFAKNIFTELNAEYIRRDAGWRENITAGFLRILSFMAREGQQGALEQSDTEDPILMVKRYIEEHYNESISLDELSVVTHYNPAYLSRYFKSVTGETITSYVQHLRVTRACIWLRESTHSFADIAMRLGYENEEYFRKIFKRITGKTPQEYRNEFGRAD